MKKVRTKVRAGALIDNHNARFIKTRTKVRAGALVENHHAKLAMKRVRGGVTVKTTVKAGQKG